MCPLVTDPPVWPNARLGNTPHCGDSWRRDGVSSKRSDIKAETHCCTEGQQEYYLILQKKFDSEKWWIP